MRCLKWLSFLSVLAGVALSGGCGEAGNNSAVPEGPSIALPSPRYESSTSIEEALRQRRSVRAYADDSLTLAELGQLLWAAQGITGEDGKRTAPSAGAIYPLDLYVLAGDVEAVSPGLYRYRPETHSIVKVLDGDLREDLFRESLRQEWIKQAPASIIITAVYDDIRQRYGDRAVRYTHMEAGHAAQNIYLQAVSLSMGTVAVGAFDDDGVKKVLGLPAKEEPLYIMPVGKTGN